MVTILVKMLVIAVSIGPVIMSSQVSAAPAYSRYRAMVSSLKQRR